MELIYKIRFLVLYNVKVDSVYCIYKQKRDYHKKNYADKYFMQTSFFVSLPKQGGNISFNANFKFLFIIIKNKNYMQLLLGKV